MVKFLLPSVFVTLLSALRVVGEGIDLESRDLDNRSVRPGIRNGHWVATWASMPQLTEPHNLPEAPFNETGRVFHNSTIRQTVKVSVGAEQIRVRFSNAFGGSDLPITAATIALPADGEYEGSGSRVIQTKTLETLTFSGSKSFLVPQGALVVSDPINFKLKPGAIVTVSLYLADGQQTNFVTSHPGSRTNSWFSFGNHVTAKNLTDSSTQNVAHWFFLSAIEAWSHKSTSTFVIIGDSITDGRGSDNDANNRWSDLLAANMRKNHFTSQIGLLNQAAGGNRILNDGLGPNVLARIDRDVLAQPGIKYALIFEGVNDIGTTDTTEEAQSEIGDRIISAYKQTIARVHAAGIPIFGATITQFMAPNSTIQPYSHPTREVTRKKVNHWIRKSGAFDAVVDFDKLLADPKDPSQLNPKYHGGDYLHPNVAGFQKMADAFPLHAFAKFQYGVDTFT
ncbi:hypothetical protein AJ80_08191 [Polytolypa hystricis UAMH7299]|uniref:SGNH hydrolase-type esterase domain-containing protein n=1 Tax=Polytolypa hystricis (strain UAMH7299) TaxID=1447883 RepID=A0A2B7XCH8_POLH7|nr:hypothetical protein AJ80_08191 [Polytolypa hystricis UAMH7299]